jgi:hypothetical protein
LAAGSPADSKQWPTFHAGETGGGVGRAFKFRKTGFKIAMRKP